MKIGVFLPDFPPDIGGGHTFEYEILGNLVQIALESHHEFTVFTPHPSNELINYLNSYPHVNLRGTENAASFWIRFQRKIKKMLNNKQQYLGDLDFTANKFSIDFIWFITPSFQPVNIPYMATVWDLQHRLQPWFPEVGNYQEWLLRENYYINMIERATFVITGNEAGAKEIATFYQLQRDRIQLLPHPTPSFALQKESTKDFLLEKFQLNRQFLFYPAQFWAHKNHSNLLHAIVILREKYHIDMDLVLVGSEKGNKDYIQGLISSMSLDEYVHILGFVSREELVALYQRAFALVYVTFFGPENLPPLEAFSLGCPVVASAVDGALEQLGDAALLVNPKDSEDIASAIKLLVDDPARVAELISRGRKRAETWTGEDFVRRAIKILDEFEAVRRTWK